MTMMMTMMMIATSSILAGRMMLWFQSQIDHVASELHSRKDQEDKVPSSEIHPSEKKKKMMMMMMMMYVGSKNTKFPFAVVGREIMHSFQSVEVRSH